MTHQLRVQKTFCTTREAAQILGISLRTVQLWVESGLLEAWKTEGGHRRVSRQSIDRLLVKPEVQEAPKHIANQPVAVRGHAVPFLILVVEDEVDLRRIYEVVLSRWPMKPRVVTVADGYEALVRIGIEKPGLVITDLHMPGMDGFKMIRALRQMPELAATGIVVVTGLDPNEIDDAGGIADDIAVLPKPIPFDQLREIAERIACAPPQHSSEVSHHGHDSSR